MTERGLKDECRASPSLPSPGLWLGEPQRESPANQSVAMKLMALLAFCNREQPGQISFMPCARSDGLGVAVAGSYAPDPGRALSE